VADTIGRGHRRWGLAERLNGRVDLAALPVDAYTGHGARVAALLGDR
jgi:hypothetical protein